MTNHQKDVQIHDSSPKKPLFKEFFPELVIDLDPNIQFDSDPPSPSQPRNSIHFPSHHFSPAVPHQTPLDIQNLLYLNQNGSKIPLGNQKNLSNFIPQSFFFDVPLFFKSIYPEQSVYYPQQNISSSPTKFKPPSKFLTLSVLKPSFFPIIPHSPNYRPFTKPNKTSFDHGSNNRIQPITDQEIEIKRNYFQSIFPLSDLDTQNSTLSDEFESFEAPKTIQTSFLPPNQKLSNSVYISAKQRLTTIRKISQTTKRNSHLIASQCRATVLNKVISNRLQSIKKKRLIRKSLTKIIFQVQKERQLEKSNANKPSSRRTLHLQKIKTESIELASQNKSEQNLRKLDILLSQTEAFAKAIISPTILLSPDQKPKERKPINESSELEVDSSPYMDPIDPMDMESPLLSPKGSHLDFDENFKEKPAYNNLLQQHSTTVKTINFPTTPQTHNTIPSFFHGTLKDYQIDGYKWLLSLYSNGLSGILADEMGLGKTVQTLAFLIHVAEFSGKWGPFLIVAPASTLFNWFREISRFVPEFKTLPYWGTKKQRKSIRSYINSSIGLLSHIYSPFHIILTSYDMIVADSQFPLWKSQITFPISIIDEAQAIKSFSTLRWQNIIQIPSNTRFLLSGTPIQNNLTELWSLLHFCLPSVFESHSDFDKWFSELPRVDYASTGSIVEQLVNKGKGNGNGNGIDTPFGDPFILNPKGTLHLDSQGFKGSNSLLAVSLSPSSSSSSSSSSGSTSQTKSRPPSRNTLGHNPTRLSQNLKRIHRLKKVLIPLLLRRTKATVASELSPKDVKHLIIPLSPFQRHLYDAISSMYRLHSSYNTIMQLKKISNSPWLFSHNFISDTVTYSSPFAFTAPPLTVRIPNVNETFEYFTPHYVNPFCTRLTQRDQIYQGLDYWLSHTCRSGSQSKRAALRSKTNPTESRPGSTKTNLLSLPPGIFSSMKSTSAKNTSFIIISPSPSPLSLFIPSLIGNHLFSRFHFFDEIRPFTLWSTSLMAKRIFDSSIFSFLGYSPSELSTFLSFDPIQQLALNFSIYNFGNNILAPPKLRFRDFQHSLQSTIDEFRIPSYTVFDNLLLPPRVLARQPEIMTSFGPLYNIINRTPTLPKKIPFSSRIGSCPTQSFCLSLMEHNYSSSLASFDAPLDSFEYSQAFQSFCNLPPKPLNLITRKPSFNYSSLLLMYSAKMQKLSELLFNLYIEGNHKILLYSQMTRVLDLLEILLGNFHYRFLRLDGVTKLEDRRDLVESFQTNDSIFIFLLSTKAGGVGINLTAADSVIFFDSDWNPQNDLQAQDRAHRIGQQKAVTVYRLISKNTVEEFIIARGNQKLEFTKMVLDINEDSDSLNSDSNSPNSPNSK